LLLAYSPKGADAAAVKAGIVKAVTFQEYLETQPMNAPAKTTEVAQALRGMKSGDKISESIIENANQEALAIENVKLAAGLREIDFENLIKTPGIAAYLYFLQKYANTHKPGNPFGIRLAETDLQGAELGTILYETVPQSNVFRTKDIESDKEVQNIASIVVQPSSEGMRFTFVRSVYGEMSMPISGVCQSVEP
jgi:hypothetical protein